MPENPTLHIAGFIENLEQKYSREVLGVLLKDKTTNKNIIWADDEYLALKNGYKENDEITIELITGLYSGVIKPRTAKELEHQSQRTRTYAEVFTPSWLCNQMNNYIDEIWFGRPKVFNRETKNGWTRNKKKIEFSQDPGKTWQDYIKCRKLEITCGEAPFICSRYDSVTGKEISVNRRIGFLDRKLRIVSENTDKYEDWLTWAFCALQNTYGYEYQGDNLLITRINVLQTFDEHLQERWGKRAEDKDVMRASKIISWNLWQMDGLSGTVPSDKPAGDVVQTSMFDFIDDLKNEQAPFCLIYNWEKDKPQKYISLKTKGSEMKKFYAAIGNPPYQDQSVGDQENYQKPIYNDFMDEAYRVAEKVELITPARFLFNAGSTPKKWNQKMLNDKHLKVLSYKADSRKVFPQQDIKGGVAITYRDERSDFGSIGVFTAFSNLNDILHKVMKKNERSFKDIVYGRGIYRYTDLLHEDHPDLKLKLSKGHKYDVSTNAFQVLEGIAFESNPEDGYEYIQLLGLRKNKRVYRWVRRDYISDHESLTKYKVFLPKSNGSGALGEVLSTPLIGTPLIGTTETFLTIGSYDSKMEAEALYKYICSKFARTLLGILKITQDNTSEKWKYVPLQDFSSSSDIDWSKSIPEIDQQLYKKYGLSKEEIEFIETHVKEMS